MRIHKRKQEPREAKEGLDHSKEELTRAEVKDILRQGLAFLLQQRKINKLEYAKRMKELNKKDECFEDEEEDEEEQY